ncbi:DHH family phosphoesterase [Miniphocaeibacter halophilus]|uniref:Bifunctional oligoribonuclease/PAP phosphatase NrnA n=1 Tax=Miniphocaeibacter halophilus TaxID=2931922 RepID=A0AC61MQ03_9FIRM|nr:bifunctional oligoribonuclease/PAP phosphatase NrnA [Miniphocaeibacter halophilus]QQK07629.1 bifunctional oligoribonuclease/PAP phosphatase NrnA [Miniphocaeibacter halophilus]
MNNLFTKFKEIIANNKSFAIISHLSPDGDNLGSIKSLYLYLKNLNKEVYPILFDKIPSNLKFITNDIPFTSNDKLIVDVLIAVDCGDKKRLGNIEYIYDNSKEIIKIDHHISGENYGTLNIIDPQISSTCELISKLFLDLNIEITPEISTSLLLGILTDTGRFLYERATEDTFQMAAKLIENGAEKDLLMKKLFQSNKLNALNAINKINNNAKFYYDNHLVITSVTNDFLNDYNLEVSDVETAINYYRDAEEVEVSCMLKEKENNKFKISFRSKNYVDVNLIANYFNGGGHKFASGCIINGDLKEVEEKIVERFKTINWQ